MNYHNCIDKSYKWDVEQKKPDAKEYTLDNFVSIRDENRKRTCAVTSQESGYILGGHWTGYKGCFWMAGSGVFLDLSADSWVCSAVAIRRAVPLRTVYFSEWLFWGVGSGGVGERERQLFRLSCILVL